MKIISGSDCHDGSLCLLKNGKVEMHVTAERINHSKHSNVCSDSMKYFGEDEKDLQYTSPKIVPHKNINAAKKASAKKLVPRKIAIKTSLKYPSNLLIIV